jgi:valyl-tRNA synthetase
MKELPKAYIPKEAEDKWYSFWEKNGFFKADVDSKKPPYSIVMPPPNVTGTLHLGHALYILQDILIRYKRMKGFDAAWFPGTDHAGISTQTVVEKHLIATLGKRRKDFSREEFIQQIWNWKEEKEEIILNQLQKIGCSCDWSRLRFTMDEKSNRAVRIIFKKMYDQGLIYQGDYLVNWDPVTQTALADDEVEYEDKASFLWYFKYPVVGSNDYIVVATTRPETMLGDSAIAIAPGDVRYSYLKGKKILLPILNREIPVIEDGYVDPSFGTGAVKVTPAHDPNDYEMGLRHNLDFINIMTPDGCINEIGGSFQGLKMLEARSAVVEKMKKLNLIEKIEPHNLRVGISYRSKAIIEPYLSKQWFLKMTAFKDKLMSAVKDKKIKMIPSHFEETYFYWINNLRDWCISRQLWWGHQIPIWYNKNDPSKMICHDGKEPPIEVQKNPDDWYQDEDVLDTWFSSALWPFSVMGWPEKTAEMERYYPNSVLLTGHEILFFWVARMILMGEYANEKVPFYNVFLYGLIYGKSYYRMSDDGSVTYVPYEEKLRYDSGEPMPSDVTSKWEKMSKSKGNIIDPLKIIDEYGADALRIALASSVTQSRQIDLDRRRFDEYKNFANKIWNATRFVLLNLDANEEKGLSALSNESLSKGLDKKLFTLEDKWIISKINRTIVLENEYIENYNFDKAATLPYDFFWNDFCANYLEIIKPVLFGNYSKELRENKQKLLVILLLDVIRLYHPIAPYITEEIFSILKERFSGIEINQNADLYTIKTINALNSPACIVAPYPGLLDQKDIDEEIEKDFNFIQEIVRSIRNIRTEINIPLSQKTDIFIIAKNSTDLKILEKNKSILLALLKIENLYFETDEKKLPKIFSTAICGSLKIIVPLPKDFIEKEKLRLEKEKEKILKQHQSLQIKLDNKDFIEKAPEDIVETLKKQYKELSLKVNEIEKKLKVL